MLMATSESRLMRAAFSRGMLSCIICLYTHKNEPTALDCVRKNRACSLRIRAARVRDFSFPYEHSFLSGRVSIYVENIQGQTDVYSILGFTAQGLYPRFVQPSPPLRRTFVERRGIRPTPASFVELRLRVLGFVKVPPAISGIHPARCIQVFGP